MWLSLAFGCSFDHSFPTNGGSEGGSIDSSVAMQDSSLVFPTDGGPNCWTLAGIGLQFCLADPLSGNVTVGSNTSIATGSSGTGALQCKALQSGSSNVCVIAASTITINAARTLSAQGTRPLVLVASTITVDGTIDVASHYGGQRGAAADAPGCDNGKLATNSGGGQGGSFGGKGGDGGNQDGQSSSRGQAGQPLTIASLRGGCRGGGGGGESSGGGSGGGAVALLADHLMLSAAARINASGSGGKGAEEGDKGGDGAGSGGMIVLSANTLLIDPSALVFANGGHGGGGSGDSASGGTGSDPIAPASGGDGGIGVGNAGSGGTGFPATTRDGTSGTSSGAGGGGGGGGAGVIKLYAPPTFAGPNMSPPPS
jgi:hypothetical protein